jgi:ribosomal protein L32
MSSPEDSRPYPDDDRDADDLSPDEEAALEHTDDATPDSAAEAEASDAEPIDLEPVAESAPRKAHVPVGKPIDDAPDESSSHPHIDTLDVCPNCGASMRTADSLVCMRCGYDMKTMQVIKPEIGEIDADDTDDDAPRSSGPSITPPGRGGTMAPGIIAGLCALIMIIAFLAGVGGLYPNPLPPDDAAATAEAVETTISFGDRMLAILRFCTLGVLWSACGFLALHGTAYLLQRRIGDYRLAAIRILAIVMAMSLAFLLDFNDRWFETPLELIAIAGIASAGTMSFFRLNAQDMGMALAIALAMFLIMFYGAQIVAWTA